MLSNLFLLRFLHLNIQSLLDASMIFVSCHRHSQAVRYRGVFAPMEGGSDMRPASRGNGQALDASVSAMLLCLICIPESPPTTMQGWPNGA